ncbi:MAG: zinc-ribbon domain-containing protein [Alphaproteobacteria bacterium]|nr:zinc-ribbon domain-containing protein [Alphaproteobacteria bacterium]
MILTCPSCDTRYSVDGAKFPAAGRTVRCAKCGHSWHQAGEGEAAPEAPEAVPKAAPAAQPEADAEAPASRESFPFSPSPNAAMAPASLPPEPRAPLGPKLAVAAGWAALIAVVLLIAVSAVRYRQDIALIWPQSAGVYSSLGLHVNASGIDFQQVDYHRETEDGQVVLAVSGMIVNAGSRQLPVPQNVRVTLSDVNDHEVYHWTFKPNATVLGPKQSVPFMTRLSSPPAAARHLEVRFAKDGS